MHIKLIDDAWFTVKRLWSVRLAVLGTAWASAGAGWLMIPEDAKPILPEALKMGIAVFSVGLAMSPGIAAAVHQPKLAAQLEERKAPDAVADAPPAAMP